MAIYQKKKCMKCGQPATHKFTRIRDGQIFDIYLCGDHAAEESPYQKPIKQIPLSEILEGLLKQENALKSGTGPVPPPGVKCRTCGLSFESYRKDLMLGCSDCYDSFREWILADLRRFHGDTRHVGRRPGGGNVEPRPQFTVRSLEEEMAGPVGGAETGALTEASPTKGAEKLLKDPSRAIDELTRTMNRAILEEDYERAARCRVQIRQIQQTLEKETGH